jgi:hypothetical protein
MWWAYASLTLAAIIFLAPPVYMFITSLKGSAEIANMRGNPWLVRDPTLENYSALLGNGMFLRFFVNSGRHHGPRRRDHHGDLGARGLRAGAHALLRQPVPRDGRVPHLPRAGHAALHPALPDRRRARAAEQPSGGWCWSIRR